MEDIRKDILRRIELIEKNCIQANILLKEKIESNNKMLVILQELKYAMGVTQ